MKNIILLFFCIFFVGFLTGSNLEGTYIIRRSIDSDSLQNSSSDSIKTTEKLKFGKEVYEQKCRKCHALYDPEDFTLKVWKRNLNEMKDKAKLSNEEYDAMLMYFTENCKKK